MRKDYDRWRILWKKEKKPGFFATQEVVVYGMHNVEYVIDNVVPENVNWDVLPM
jgi:hypothetical protein